MAATYALLPVAMGAVAAGRLGTAVAFVLLPLAGIMIGRMLTQPPQAARRAAWAAGLIVAIAAAFVPLVWPIAVLAALAAAVAWPWLGLRTVVNAVIAAAVPAAILEPWAFHLVTSPSAFFSEAGLSRPGLAVAGLRPGSLLLLSPGGPGLPPVWVTAGLVLPAFGALLARRRMALVYAGWSVALTGLVLALVVSRVRVTPPQGGPAVSAWPGVAIAIAAAGLLLAAAPLVEVVGRPRHQADLIVGRVSRTNWRVLAMLAGFAVAVSAPVLAAGYWLAAGVGGTVTAASPQILPAFVAAASAGPNRNRTLVLRQAGGTLSYAVLRDTDPVLGEPELTETSSSTQALAGVVASLAAAGGGDTGDTGQALSQFDIGYVLLPAPVDQALAQQLDAAAGLQPLTKAAGYDLWQVSGTVARARVVASDGTVVPVASGSIGVDAVLAPGTSGTLVLAEAAGGWSATLDGKPLTSLAAPVDGWAQGFVLPAGGGRLVVTRNETARDISLGVEAVALFVAFVLALPGTRSSVPATAEARADSEAIPAQGRRERAESPRAARRRRRPQLAPAGARAGARGDARVDVEVGAGASAATQARGAEDTVAGRASFASSGSASAQPPFSAQTPFRLAATTGSAQAPFSNAAPVGSAAPAALSPDADPMFGSAATAASAPGDDADYARAGSGSGSGSGSGHQAAVGAVQAPGYGSGPASSSAPARRGQHAARHGKGKPARRWRGSNTAKSAAQTEQTQTPTSDTRSAAEAAEVGETSAADSRAPWERGDAR
jgi:hypothetical protein